MPSVFPNTSTGLTITNPLVLYRALLATKRIDPDPSQHRLALHLQKLYFRLKDYEPAIEYSSRLKQIQQAVGGPDDAKRSNDDPVAPPGNDVRMGLFSSLLAHKEKRNVLALTQVMTSRESALTLNSPKGLLLYGEVGTGKSMLIDLLADCLPSRKKRRWHFNTFMLDTFGRLEQLRREYELSKSRPVSGMGEPVDQEYSLLRLARDMISTSPILFLDEFQLPDRAASKILLNLLTSFFHLGGVLIATSNRMPEELAKASGIAFAPPPSRPGLFRHGLSRNWGWGGSLGGGRRGGLFDGKEDFAGFLDVLKARCEVWDMEGQKDWRRRDRETKTADSNAFNELTSFQAGYSGLEPMTASNVSMGYEPNTINKEVSLDSNSSDKGLPRNYFIDPPQRSGSENKSKNVHDWESAVFNAISSHDQPSSPTNPIPWKTTSVRVYGRSVNIPRAYQGVSSWTFAELCASNLGPADYITLASTFHTLILTDVPVLTLLQKNEARRLITLLDALYEARCKLLISAAAGPDSIFFPEANSAASKALDGSEIASGSNSGDAVYAETFAEMHQDATAPFRPNVAAYASPASSMTSTRSVLADEDSDFGPVPGAGNEIGRSGDVALDFSHTGAFTGEDERFAYKRASSRLWEMCGARWWGRAEPGWWRPLPTEVRQWEVSSEGSHLDRLQGTSVDDKPGAEHFRHGASPFRVSKDPPPKFSGVHAWGMMNWGKKAGRWGQGVEGLADKDGEQKG